MTESDVLILYAQTSFKRVDKFISSNVDGITRSYVKKLIKAGNVKIDGTIASPSSSVTLGQSIEIIIDDDEIGDIEPEEISIDVVYEDDDIIIVNKPAGLIVHPGAGHKSGTLVNALLARYPEIIDVGPGFRPGIIHRLDKDTSGLLVVAKNIKAHANISQQIADRSVTKIYTTLVRGHMASSEVLIEAPIARDPQNRKKMAVVEKGKYALTGVKVIDHFKEFDLLEIKLFTGRTHQIRVHLESVGLPIVGDASYGIQHTAIDRQFLHSCYLGFNHPSFDTLVEFNSDLPYDLQTFLDSIRVR